MINRQLKQHPASTVDSRVGTRHCCRQHDKVDQTSCSRDADFFKRFNKWGTNRAQLIPRIDGNDDENSSNVEDQDSPDNGFNRLNNGFLR